MSSTETLLLRSRQEDSNRFQNYNSQDNVKPTPPRLESSRRILFVSSGFSVGVCFNDPSSEAEYTVFNRSLWKTAVCRLFGICDVSVRAKIIGFRFLATKANSQRIHKISLGSFTLSMLAVSNIIAVS